MAEPDESTPGGDSAGAANGAEADAAQNTTQNDGEGNSPAGDAPAAPPPDQPDAGGDDEAGGQVLIAKESFACEIDGVPVIVRKGKTRVRAEHEIVKGREQLFEPVEAGVQFGATAPAKKPAARSRSGRGRRSAK